MTDYAIGDIQGCYDRMRDVLAKVEFSPSRDRLWVAGDLINRGPSSLETLRYLESLGSSAVVVLGNHDLHLLAVALGGHPPKRKDTLADILEAPDHDRLVAWLRQQNLSVHDPDRNLIMVHAGVPHIWSADQTMAYAREVESVIRSDEAEYYFTHMYGNEPACWHESLRAWTVGGQSPITLPACALSTRTGRWSWRPRSRPSTHPRGMLPGSRMPGQITCVWCLVIGQRWRDKRAAISSLVWIPVVSGVVCSP